MQKKLVGDLKGSIATFQQLFAETDNRPGLGGWLFNSLRNIAEVVLLSGDIAQAEGYMRRLESKIVEMRTSGIPQKREAYAQRGRAFELDLESVRAVLFEARGNYRDAEAAYKKATDYRRGWIQDSKKTDYPPPESQIRQNVDSDLLNVARMKAKQGRLAEAEADARAVLLNRLKEQGKYNPLTTRYVMGLAGILIEQGRYPDAEKLVRSALDIQRTLGIKDETQHSAQILSQLGVSVDVPAKDPGSRSDICGAGQGDCRLGAGRQAGARAQWLAHLGALFFRAGRGRHCSCAGGLEAVGRPGRRASFRFRGGARHSGGRLFARKARCRCDPRVQGGDPDPDGGIA